MRYLLVPKIDDFGEEVATEAAPVGPELRIRRLERLVRRRQAAAAADKRLDELLRRRQGLESTRAPSSGRRSPGADDAPSGELDREAEVVNASGVISVLATPARETPVTGITILDAGPGAKNVLTETFPDHDVVEDFSLALIEPPDALAENGTPSASAVTVTEPWHLQQIGLLDARRRGFGLTGDGVVIGVLDTGVADVPELSGRILENRVFDETLFDYRIAEVADTDWHGTHVAGLIAGQTVGVAPGSRLVSLTMIPKRIGSFSHYVFALEHLQARPEIQIISMSAGKLGQHPQMRNMARIAQRLDVICIMAIGNSGINTSCSPGNYPEVISVGASDCRGRIWDRSSGGAITWDGMQHATPTLVAPGVDIVSSLPDGSYRAESGTSMAAPIVTGIAALLVEKHPDITVRQLREEILSACVSLGLDVEGQGAGEVRLPPSLLVESRPPILTSGAPGLSEPA
jgi:subtilisin family serine protease